MLIEITTCSIPQAYWYKDKIGVQVHAEEIEGDYRVTDGPYSGNIIDRSDGAVIT